MKSVNVQPYSNEHQEQVVKLISTIQQKEFHIPITVEEQPDLFSVEEFYQTGKGNFWLAIYGGRVVGTISLLDIGNDLLALRKMFVEKDYRGAPFHIASKLLDEAVGWAKEKEVQAIYLGTTPQFLAAHRFYEKNDFVRIDSIDLPKNFPVLAVDKRFYKLDTRVRTEVK
ncbi:GNAT family N-acetyltransferase [Guptibacillus algicola]|uniref:GNAT family N-acetyltransferase n=1 Tax=Guptibacillus algicola TaxID=225844 RepID=UPI001CD4F698|nr:GNAT family N-acetyltransferase [Alkalihalobacillus algicola]MCA0988454.1 GNAT family N-acetyltransferase [Alkalihalobacillus algicola]